MTLLPIGSTRRGFTLVELLCAISVIALLGVVLFVAFGSPRKRGHDTVCFSNLRQMGAAIRIYGSDYDDDLPHSLNDLHPQYVSDIRVFRCPAWVARYESDIEENRSKCEKMFTLYAFMPAEQRFWATVPPERDDPKELSEEWEAKYKREGEHSELIRCQFHDPYLGRALENPKGPRQLFFVLYTDGSVGRREWIPKYQKSVYRDL